jgi:hypothetical protein
MLYTHLHLGPVVSFPPAFLPVTYMHSTSPPFARHALPTSSSSNW